MANQYQLLKTLFDQKNLVHHNNFSISLIPLNNDSYFVDYLPVLNLGIIYYELSVVNLY